MEHPPQNPNEPRPCCALRMGIERLKGVIAIDGARFTCTVAGGCGRTYERRWGRWELVPRRQVIAELQEMVRDQAGLVPRVRG